MASALASLGVPTGRKAQRTWRTLVEQTRAVATATGSFNAEQVAERAGMSPATFYAYFPTKDEALAGALDAVLSELVDRTLLDVDLEHLVEDGLRPMIERAVTTTLEVFTESAVVMRLALARLPESRTIRDVYRHHQRTAKDALVRFVRLGINAGRLSTADPESATLALLVGLQGLNNPLLLARRSDDPVVQQVVDMLVFVLDPDGVGS